MEELTLTARDKQDARIALLRHYSSERVAHGAYLVTIAVGFFGLVEAIPLILKFVTSIDFLPFTPELAGGIVVGLILSFFIVLFICILGRTFIWGHLATAVLSVKPKEESEVKEEEEKTTATYIQRLHLACVDYVRKNHKWSATFYTLRISTLALIWFYLFVIFAIISLVLLHLH